MNGTNSSVVATTRAATHPETDTGPSSQSRGFSSSSSGDSIFTTTLSTVTEVTSSSSSMSGPLESSDHMSTTTGTSMPPAADYPGSTPSSASSSISGTVASLSPSATLTSSEQHNPSMSTQASSSISSGTVQASAPLTTPSQPITTPSRGPSDKVTRASGLPVNTVAGIGVASAAGGIIVAAIIVFCLCQKRRKSSLSRRTHIDAYQDHSDTFSGTTAGAIIEKRNANTIKDVDFLPSASDRELQEDFTKLNSAIRKYVEIYCTADTEVAFLRQDNAVYKLDGLPELLIMDALLSEGDIDRLLKTPQTRLSAIRFLIAWNIFSNIRLDAPLATTLLPPEVSRFIEALEPIPLAANGSVTARPASPFRCPSPSSMRIVTDQSDDWMTSLHKWRQVTGASMAAIYGDGIEQQQQLDWRDPRKQNISELTATLVCVLQPFVVKGYGAARVKELEKVVTKGAQLGWKLFSQPTTWSFGWVGREEEDEEEVFVVFPSLVKVAHEHGQRLQKPIYVSEAEVA